MAPTTLVAGPTVVSQASIHPLGRAPRHSRLQPLVRCAASSEQPREPVVHQRLASAAATAVLAGSFLLGGPAAAELNKYEYSAGGEFGIGSAQQFGEADESDADFHGQDLRRSNFTAADVRRANFRGAKLNASYLMKAVMFQTDFTGADLSDSLMDRAVMNEANLTNAVLQRVILTRSDLKDAVVDGADFSNALIDKFQQQALCKYASGTNPVTGVDTRQSLGCSSRRRRMEQTPSSMEGPQVKQEDKDAYLKSLPVYRQ